LVAQQILIRPAARQGGWDNIHGHRFIVAADHHAFERLIGARIDFLMRHIGRYEDKIAGDHLRRKIPAPRPLASGLALHDIDHAFQFAMMMASAFASGLMHGAGPNLPCAGSERH
jgi:hypothetical protein